MSSRREEERNEKIIRGLMKLPPNRRCINCDSLGPQYVCTNFWTFVCMTCSGIHREFTHRVKSVSMAKFTTQEVEALQKGGNQRAREIYLKNWDLQRQRLPVNSNAEKIREFIKTVYVDKRYAGGQSMDRPPRDTQNLRGHADETRRASSYHSYSQSPPYDFQYEERIYGKPGPTLTRKPGSDRGLYDGKVSSFSSPSHLSDHMNEDRFANEGSNPRASDFSVSSGGDPVRFEVQSPNYQRDTGFPGHTQRIASLGSFGSLDNSLSFNSVSSFDLTEAGSEPEQSVKIHHNKLSALPSLPQSSLDLCNAPATSQTIPSASNVANFTESSSASQFDLFKHLPTSPDPTLGSCQMPHIPASGLELFSSMVPNQQSDTQSSNNTLINEGWATFDMPQDTAPVGSEKFTPVFAAPLSDGNSLKLFSGIPSPTPDAVSIKGPSDAVIHMNDGWTAFDMPHQMEPIGPGAFLENNSPHLSLLHFPSIQGSTPNGPSFPYSEAQGGFPSVPASSHGGIQNAEATPSGSSAPWKAFESSSDFLALQGAQSSNQQKFADHETLRTEVRGGHQLSTISSYGGLREPSRSKSTNPFDIPYESNIQTNNTPDFWDMSSVQATLPNGEMPMPFAGEIREPWFAQNTVASYISAVGEGTLGFISAQPTGNQISNAATQGPIGGKNPFA
ncbi:unnamed protein product [Cuscuta campestris]|uniref:Arf-GAP domain-containing protein n=1 Tax=Cuscuta campestris TaxID=132261 RepID=A0A484KWC8_9ASTE|nr:unnamed protein product [Cuscuta campestris]